MARTTTFRLPPTGEPTIDALSNGTYWVLDGTRTVTWAVADSPGIDWKWNAYGATLMRDAMSSVLSKYAEVADIRFEYVGWFDNQRTAPADIVLAATLFPLNLGMPPSVYAWAYFPYEPGTDAQIAQVFGTSAAYPNASGDVILNYLNYEISNSTFTPGSNGYFALLHEVGHALGLKHPHDNGGTLGRPTFEQIGYSDADSQLLTVMSYDPATSLALWFQQFGLPSDAGYPESLMPLDVLALQSIYGPNMTTRAGSDVYELYNNESIETFWDAGGEDVVSARNSLFGWGIIAVPSSEFENLVVAIPHDWNTTTGKFYFNIEHFVGSEYDDLIFATSASNYIAGFGGNDAMAGAGGDDTIWGGAGLDIADYVWSRAEHTVYRESNDWIVESATWISGIDRLTEVERLRFTDGSIALDVGLGQSGGNTVLLLGATLPGQLVFDPSKQELLGAVIDLFDQGYSLRDLSGALLRLPVWDVLTGLAAPTNRDIANYLLANVNGSAPDQATLDMATNALNTETFQGDWFAGLAGSAANQLHVGLVGLMDTGLEFVAPQS